MNKAIIYRVEKLMYVPLNKVGSSDDNPAAADQPFIDMLEKVQSERAFYFSYDLDLTKNF